MYAGNRSQKNKRLGVVFTSYYVVVEVVLDDGRLGVCFVGGLKKIAIYTDLKWRFGRVSRVRQHLAVYKHRLHLKLCKKVHVRKGKLVISYNICITSVPINCKMILAP